MNFHDCGALKPVGVVSSAEAPEKLRAQYWYLPIIPQAHLCIQLLMDSLYRESPSRDAAVFEGFV